MDELLQHTKIFRFYKFMETRWVKEFLLNDTIKATALSKANDPLEWLPSFENRDEEENWHKKVKSQSHVLCLSSKISESSMWGHYAAAHKGACVAFDLPLCFSSDKFAKQNGLPITIRSYSIGELKTTSPLLFKVHYLQTRPLFNHRNILSTTYLLISSKGQGWSSESEYRIIADNSLYKESEEISVFKGFRKYLSGIILGLNTPPKTEQEIRDLVAQSKLDLPIIRASLHLTDYSIIAPPFQDTDIEELDNWTILNYQAEQNKQ